MKANWIAIVDGSKYNTMTGRFCSSFRAGQVASWAFNDWMGSTNEETWASF